jgi:hypothetical protein
MADEQVQMPVCYRVDIGQEFPNQRKTSNVPHWELLVEILAEAQRTAKAQKWSLDGYAIELANTAIGKKTLVNDPHFKPYADEPQKVDFEKHAKLTPTVILRSQISQPLTNVGPGS